MRQRAVARDAPSPFAEPGSPLRDGSRGGCGAQPALLPRLLLFLLLLRAPLRPSRSAHGKRPPPRAAARPPAKALPRGRAAALRGRRVGDLGPRRVGGSARAGQGQAVREVGPPSCRAWLGRDPGATRRGRLAVRRPKYRPPGFRLASLQRRPARRFLLSRALLSGDDSLWSFVPCPRLCGGDPSFSRHSPLDSSRMS